MNRMLLLSWVFLLLSLDGLWAQSNEGDILLSQEAYFDWIVRHHPFAMQADLIREEAEAVMQKARGGFDPKLEGDWDQKFFDGKSYYNLAQGGLKIPTWYGLEVKGEYAWSDGVFLNPERNLPAIGQASFGVSANVLQGLVIDKRRADLQKARIFQQASEVERRQVLNDLLMKAGDTYWAWTLIYNELLVYEQAYQFSQERFEGIRESFIQGDKAAVDTLESWIQVQNWENQLAEANLKYQKASLALSNFLWLNKEVPLEVNERVQPPRLADLTVLLPSREALRVNLENLDNTQPALQLYQYKLASLEVDRRLKQDKLKPVLQLDYYLLGNGFDFVADENGNGNGVGLGDIFGENYKVGATFRFPLFLRKERGDLELARLKIKDNSLQLQQKQLEWGNKVESYFVELENMSGQIDRLDSMVDNYEELLNVETIKFDIGESSLFLLNSRQQKLLEAQLKLAKVRSRWHKARMGLDWSSGTIGQ